MGYVRRQREVGKEVRLELAVGSLCQWEGASVE